LFTIVFFGLLGDLFPGIDPPRKVNPTLEENVTQACVNLGNHPDDVFRLKCVQLEELLEIRHCVFVMGPPGAGKSQCWRTLAEARTIRGDKTKVVDINPKSVKTEELYGFISMATREWKDGLLSKIMRDLGEIPDEKPKWIILDGDLDANWIESMNSVMDDNKILTLINGDRIPLTNSMSLVFETQDLRVASPATVSRAGMIYIDAAELGWRTYVESWLNKKFGTDEESKTFHKELFEKWIPKVLKFKDTNCKEPIKISEFSSVMNLCTLYDALAKVEQSFKKETIGAP
jgi:dynein heavy chain